MLESALKAFNKELSSLDALELMHRLADHQAQVDGLLAQERLLICVGSRLLAVSMVRAHFGMLQAPGHGTQPRLLQGRPGLLGCVTRSDEALRLIHRQRPSLLLCTERLEDGTGIALIRAAKAFDPALKTLLFLEHRSSVLYASALDAHPDGFMLEPLMGRGYLLLALRTICEGGMYLDPEIASVLHGSTRDTDPGLTLRELDVMQQVVHGLSDRQIADHLQIATPTVKHHLQQVYQKLSVRNRTRAAIALLLLGLVDPPTPLLPNEAAA